MTTFYMGNKMFSEIKHQIAKKKKKKKSDSGKEAQKFSRRGYKIHRKNTAIKVFHFLLCCPFYKVSGQEISEVCRQTENAIHWYLLLITTTELPVEKNATFLFLKKIYTQTTNCSLSFNTILSLKN